MKICDEKKEQKSPELIMGHLYQYKDEEIFICANENRLVRLEDGAYWAANRGFDGFGNDFTDVTDQYCLKKIND